MWVLDFDIRTQRPVQGTASQKIRPGVSKDISEQLCVVERSVSNFKQYHNNQSLIV